MIPPALIEMLLILYARPCLICGRSGPCGHREPEVEIALLNAALRAGDAPLRKVDPQRAAGAAGRD